MMLFEPINIGRLQLKNRIIMPPMGTGLADHNGFVTDRLIDYYVRRAQGGVGAISVEATIITEETAGVGPETRIHGAEFVPGLAKLVDAVHDHGVPIGIQLWHPGRQTTLGKPIAPSPIPIARRGPIPHALTLDEIDEVMVRYAEGARHAREAGFDFVEVHGAHCYLPCEFLSPVSNVRDDEYGGSLANRARFMRRVAESIRDTVGADYPFVYRISGTEAQEGGFTIDDAVQVAAWLEEDGVDCISVSAGNWHALHYTIPPMFMERGCLVPYAEQIRAAVGVPVIAAGRLDEPQVAESVLREGRADIVAIGRGLIADPDWPAKVESGRIDEIRPCIACNACVDLVAQAQEARCAVNPALGRDGTWRVDAAPTVRRVMVVGGGPAGMEAARIARLRGHEVSLWERASELGGKLDVAGRAPSKHPVGLFREYQSRVLTDLGVDVRTGVNVTPEIVEGEAPDALIVATGASPLVPPIPGIDGSNIVDADAVLLGDVQIEPGERVAVIGGSATGVETAEFLMGVAGEITVLEMLPRIGRGVELITLKRLRRELLDGGVHLATGCRVTGIEPDAVVFEQTDGSEGTLEVDRVILAIGWKPTGEEFVAGLSVRDDVQVVGDAAQAGDFVAAINAGADAGLAV